MLENFRPALSADRYSSRSFPRNPPYVAWIPVATCSGRFPSGAGMTAPTRAGPRSLSFNLRSNMGSLPQPAKGIFVFILFQGFREIKKNPPGCTKTGDPPHGFLRACP